LDYST